MPWQYQWPNIWSKLSPLNHPSGRKWGMVYGSDRSPWKPLCYVMHARFDLLKRWKSARVTHPPLQLSYTCLCGSWRLWCRPSERSPAWTSHPRWPIPADWWLRLQVDTLALMSPLGHVWVTSASCADFFARRVARSSWDSLNNRLLCHRTRKPSFLASRRRGRVGRHWAQVGSPTLLSANYPVMLPMVIVACERHW